MSSAQNEFRISRIQLEKKISDIPFLTCTLLENMGASSHNTLQASLKGVRDCDIYVGLFGMEFSDTTIKEYREAVRQNKAIFTYINKNKDKSRDPRLVKFIENELKPNYKYYHYKNNQDLFVTVHDNLSDFLFELILKGLEVKNEISIENQSINEKVQNMQSKLDQNTVTENLINDSEVSFQDKDYIHSYLKSFIALESWLRSNTKLRMSRDPNNMKQSINIDRAPLSMVLEISHRIGLIDSNDLSTIKDFIPTRNRIVHNGEVPNTKLTKHIMTFVENLLER